jgi:hypothetical protein
MQSCCIYRISGTRYIEFQVGNVSIKIDIWLRRSICRFREHQSSQVRFGEPLWTARYIACAIRYKVSLCDNRCAFGTLGGCREPPVANKFTTGNPGTPLRRDKSRQPPSPLIPSHKSKICGGRAAARKKPRWITGGKGGGTGVPYATETKSLPRERKAF